MLERRASICLARHLWGFNRVEIKWLSRDDPSLLSYLTLPRIHYTLLHYLHPYNSRSWRPFPTQASTPLPGTWTGMKRFYRCSNGINPSWFSRPECRLVHRIYNFDSDYGISPLFTSCSEMYLCYSLDWYKKNIISHSIGYCTTYEM